MDANAACDCLRSGGGSNLLLPDQGFDGLVLHMAPQGPVAQTGSQVTAPAGCNWDELVLRVCEQGLSGMECLAGIPGLVGGAPIQNIGAYGQEVAQTITAVRAFDREADSFVELTRNACAFQYRSSVFNTTASGRYLVTSVTFSLNPAGTPELGYADLRRYFAGAPQPTAIEVYHAVRAIRREKGMLLVEGDANCRSAGSFFKNPLIPASMVERVAAALQVPVAEVPRYPAGEGNVKLAAAWLLERVGFPKGFSLGRAGISSRHTLALVNRGGATQADIARLRDLIRDTVRERLGIVLEQEPVEP